MYLRDFWTSAYVILLFVNINLYGIVIKTIWENTSKLKPVSAYATKVFQFVSPLSLTHTYTHSHGHIMAAIFIRLIGHSNVFMTHSLCKMQRQCQILSILLNSREQCSLRHCKTASIKSSCHLHLANFFVFCAFKHIAAVRQIRPYLNAKREGGAWSSSDRISASKV